MDFEYCDFRAFDGSIWRLTYEDLRFKLTSEASALHLCIYSDYITVSNCLTDFCSVSFTNGSMGVPADQGTVVQQYVDAIRARALGGAA